jgi:hypothetical protein
LPVQLSRRVRFSCLFCNRFQSRHVRVGHFLRCRYCKEVNPGPAVLAKMAEQFAKKSPDAVRQAARRLKARAAELPAAAVTTIGTPADPVPNGRQEAATTAPTKSEDPEKQDRKPTTGGGLLSRIVYGN